MLVTRPSLVQRLRNPQDRKSWEEFVNLYTPLLLQWAHREGDRDAEDSIQEIFVVLLNKLPSFQYDAGRSFRAWLKTILKHIVWKKGKRKNPGQLDEEIAVPDPLSEQEDTEARRHLLARALGMIKEEFEESIWRSFWECVVNGRPAKEVATELGITVGAIWTAISRMRARLRERFAQELD